MRILPHLLTLLLSCTLTGLAAEVAAQHGPAHSATTGGESPAQAPAEARQFDFLLGEWEIEMTRKVSGLAAMLHGTPKLLGTWTATSALDGFGVSDQLRLLDEAGNPVNLTQQIRVYDRRSGQWKISALDVYRAQFSQASGKWDAASGEMRLEGHGLTGEGRPYASRSRFSAISATGFTLVQDRSYDSGETWEEATMSIVATRAAATP